MGPGKEDRANRPPSDPIPSSRRSFSAAPRQRSVDQGTRAQTMLILAWSPAGLVLGFLLGVYGGLKFGWGGGMVLLCSLVGWLCAVFGPMWISGLGAKAITLVYNPRGSSVPPRKQYSRAEALAARGHLEEAVAAFAAGAFENPEDPEPYLRAARILRDEMKAPADAVQWLKRARREARMSEGRAIMITREIVELYLTHMNDPGKARPELARLAEEGEGTEVGAWAARELEELRRADGEPGEEPEPDGASRMEDRP